MPSIRIESLPPYNGEYPIDLAFTNRDFHTIKQIAGLRPNEVEDAFTQQDNDLVVAFAVNALRRAGHAVDLDRLWDAPVGRITVVGDEVEADAAPPPDPSSDAETRPLERTPSSGTSGRSDGDSTLASDPRRTGSPLSATDAASVPATSVI